ncbi:hypothetical protein Tco_0600314 [Tanacetum coccineum]|uniref:Uncharacterized protein n=1 Tax=Tanacetum coccineum TaxID=301880 RepID=A0ABQ4WBE2_9ASTR
MGQLVYVGGTYLLDGAIDGGEANGIIRDPNTRSNADLRRLVSFDVFGKARVVGRIIEATSANAASVVKSRDEIPLRRGYRDNRDLSRQDLGFIPSGNVVLSSTYVGKILGADQLLVILCYRYQESGIGYWILSMTISGSGVTFLPSCCNGSGVTFLPSELNGAKIERSG